jgi:hypothetical protein
LDLYVQLVLLVVVTGDDAAEDVVPLTPLTPLTLEPMEYLFEYD